MVSVTWICLGETSFVPQSVQKVAVSGLDDLHLGHLLAMIPFFPGKRISRNGRRCQLQIKMDLFPSQIICKIAETAFALKWTQNGRKPLNMNSKNL